MSAESKKKSVVNFVQDLNGITQNAVFPEHLSEYTYCPKTLIDETLENIDPTPDVHNMFIQFNQLFFWNKLDSVYVKWSKRMTTCAGTCSFHPRSRECVITLSAPLLKLRPRKDLVETLLHEMIHGYLFVTNNNRDRDGHGPEFCKHMYRINKASGTNITIYHSFHDEVRLYQQHWWKCDGPCKNRPPYFGTVRRAMNRAPGPSDFWWKDHQFNCGGKFIKIREPEKPPTKSSSKSTSRASPKDNRSIKSPIRNISKPPSNQNTLDNFISNNKNNSASLTSSSGAEVLNRQNFIRSSNSSVSDSFKKLGNSTNNVFGFGTGGPGSQCSNQSSVKSPESTNSNNNKKSISFSGTIGGSVTGKSRLLDLYSTSPESVNSKQVSEIMISDGENDDNHNSPTNGVECPVCNQMVFEDINNHIDVCLTQEPLPKRRKVQDNEKKFVEKTQECPVCNNKFLANELVEHTEVCLSTNNYKSPPRVPSSPVPTKKNNNSAATVMVSCPICNKGISNQSINDHVDLCLLQQETGKNTQVGTSSGHHLTTVDLTSPIKRSDIINCCTCQRDINAIDYYEHVQKCLAELAERSNQYNEIIEIPDTDNMMASCSSRNGGNNYTKLPSSPHYKCLVCNELICKNIPLEEHLDVCVKVMFHDSDDSSDSTITNHVNSKKTKLLTAPDKNDDKQLCPICMELISDKLIAAHVNQCDNFRL